MIVRLTILIFSLMVPAASAQTTGTVTGVLSDSSGGVLPGVSVVARHVDTGLARTTATNEDGRYVFSMLPVGSYELRVDLQGFKTLTFTGISLRTSVRRRSLPSRAMPMEKRRLHHLAASARR